MTAPNFHPATDIFIGEVTSVGTPVSGVTPHGFKEKTLSTSTYGLVDKVPGRSGTSTIEPVVTLTGSALTVGDLVFMRRRGWTSGGSDGIIYECVGMYGGDNFSGCQQVVESVSCINGQLAVTIKYIRGNFTSSDKPCSDMGGGTIIGGGGEMGDGGTKPVPPGGGVPPPDGASPCPPGFYGDWVAGAGGWVWECFPLPPSGGTGSTSGGIRSGMMSGSMMLGSAHFMGGATFQDYENQTILDVVPIGEYTAPDLTGDVNNYAPVSPLPKILHVSTDDLGARAITGLAGGTAGREIIIINVGNVNAVTLTTVSGSSSAANQFFNGTPAPANISLAMAGGLAHYIHNGTNWRLIRHET